MTIWRVEVWNRGVLVATLPKMAGTYAAIASQMKAVYGPSATVKLVEHHG